ncbi:MAG: hypothetical protein R2710_13620 [Acidimicrobiales bacterium]
MSEAHVRAALEFADA